MQFAILLIAAYLSGSIPFGYLIARAKGKDIRTIGSGNIGGTNVSRAFGVKWGVLVGVLDVLKGFIPALVAIFFLRNPWELSLVLLAPVIGHIFPVWLRFKGGKGMACLFGTLCPLLTGYQIIIILLVWVLALKLVKIMSLVNIVYVLMLPFLLWSLYRQPAFVVYAVLIDCIIWYAHRSNIRRLRKGTELKLSI